MGVGVVFPMIMYKKILDSLNNEKCHLKQVQEEKNWSGKINGIKTLLNLNMMQMIK